jgi:hypothetical protein
MVIVLLTESLGGCMPRYIFKSCRRTVFLSFSVVGFMHKCSKLRSKLLGHATSSCHLLQCRVVSSQLSTTIVRSQGRIASKQNVSGRGVFQNSRPVRDELAGDMQYSMYHAKSRSCLEEKQKNLRKKSRVSRKVSVLEETQAN